jgi:hypothetical protein
MNIIDLYYIVWTVVGILTAIAIARRELRRSRRRRKEVVIRI